LLQITQLIGKADEERLCDSAISSQIDFYKLLERYAASGKQIKTLPLVVLVQFLAVLVATWCNECFHAESFPEREIDRDLYLGVAK
jgi:hypothetical protein